MAVLLVYPSNWESGATGKEDIWRFVGIFGEKTVTYWTNFPGDKRLQDITSTLSNQVNVLLRELGTNVPIGKYFETLFKELGAEELYNNLREEILGRKSGDFYLTLTKGAVISLGDLNLVDIPWRQLLFNFIMVTARAILESQNENAKEFFLKRLDDVLKLPEYVNEKFSIRDRIFIHPILYADGSLLNSKESIAPEDITRVIKNSYNNLTEYMKKVLGLQEVYAIIKKENNNGNNNKYIRIGLWPLNVITKVDNDAIRNDIMKFSPEIVPLGKVHLYLQNAEIVDRTGIPELNNTLNQLFNRGEIEPRNYLTLAIPIGAYASGKTSSLRAIVKMLFDKLEAGWDIKTVRIPGGMEYNVAFNGG